MRDEILSGQVRRLAQELWHVCYRGRRIPLRELENRLSQVVSVRLAAIGSRLEKEKLSVYARWLIDRLVKAARAHAKGSVVDPHSAGIDIFGTNPNFEDPDFEIIARSHDQVIAYRVSMESDLDGESADVLKRRSTAESAYKGV